MNTLLLGLGWGWGSPAAAAPLLQRLLAASFEAGVLTLGVAALMAVARPRSPRVRSLLWLVVLLKPLVSLALGSMIPVVLLEAPPVLAAPAPAEPVAATAAVHSQAGLTPAQVLVCLWMAGVLVAGNYYLWVRLRLHRIIRAAQPADRETTGRYQSIAAQLGLRRLPRLAISPALESPAIVGLVSPTVLIPAWLASEANGRRLEWSMRHELTHWRWLDPVSVLVRDAALVLFWFHPAVWWSGRRLVETMELACDQAMLARPAEATEYAEQLFGILQSVRDRRRRAIVGGLFATRTQIGKRIAALLESSPTLRSGISLRSGVVLGLVAGLAFAAGIGFAGGSRGDDAAATPTATLTPEAAQPAKAPMGFAGATDPPAAARAGQESMGFGGNAPPNQTKGSVESDQAATPPKGMGFGGNASPRRSVKVDQPTVAPRGMGFGGNAAPRGMGGEARPRPSDTRRRVATPRSGMGFGGTSTRPG